MSGTDIVTAAAFFMMLIGCVAVFITAASHTPYGLAGAAMFTFVSAVVYHKAPE